MRYRADRLSRIPRVNIGEAASAYWLLVTKHVGT